MSHAAGPNRNKVAGLVLLGVAAVALVIGLVTVIGSGGQSRADDGHGSSSSANARPPGSSGATPSSPRGSGQPGQGGNGSGGNGSGGSGSGGNGGGNGPGNGSGNGSGGNGGGGNTTTVVPPPPAGGGGTSGSGAGNAGGGTAQPVADRSSPVRVYNNSTIKGLAHKAAADFRAAGYHVVQVANYSQGVIPVSTVYWGTTAERGTAVSLARHFGLRSDKRFRGIEHASRGVIVIVTNNYPR